MTTTTPTPTLIENQERSAKLMWTAFILMFFLIQAIIWTVAISITSRDMSHAVVSGYDQHALTWDDVRAKQEASAALGWQSSLLVDSAADIRGNRILTMQLTDADGNPVERAHVALKAFHRGAAAEPQQVLLQESGPGVYSTMIRVNRFGSWCFEGEATLADQVYLIDTTIAVSKPAG